MARMEQEAVWHPAATQDPDGLFIAAVRTDRQAAPGRSDIFQGKRWEQSAGRSSPIRWRKWVMNSNMVAARLWWMR